MAGRSHICPVLVTWCQVLPWQQQTTESVLLWDFFLVEERENE